MGLVVLIDSRGLFCSFRSPVVVGFFVGVYLGGVVWCGVVGVGCRWSCFCVHAGIFIFVLRSPM